MSPVKFGFPAKFWNLFLHTYFLVNNLLFYLQIQKICLLFSKNLTQICQLFRPQFQFWPLLLYPHPSNQLLLSLFGPYLLYYVSLLHLPPNSITRPLSLPCSLLSESSSCQVEESITWTGGKAEQMCLCTSGCQLTLGHMTQRRRKNLNQWSPTSIPETKTSPFLSFPLYSQQSLYTKTIK